MNILVTGANGQLGSELNIISKGVSGHAFFFTDIPELDITDINAVSRFINGNKIDFIINCAAYTAVDKAESEKEFAYKINATGPAVLSQAAKIADITLIHISTDYVFDGRASVPYKEDSPTRPTGVYGASKLEGEQNIRHSGCKSIIIRTAWLYSEFGNNFVKTMIKLGKERQELKVVSDQKGSPTYARDLAAAILDIIPALSANPRYGEVYHYSNMGVCTWYDFAKKIIELSGIDCKVSPITTKDYPTPAARPAFSVLDKSKIIKDFGLCIPDWEDSLAVCLKRINHY